MNVHDTLEKIKKARADYENYVKQSNPISNDNFLLKFFKKSTNKDIKTNENDHELNSSAVSDRNTSNVNFFIFSIFQFSLFCLP